MNNLDFKLPAHMYLKMNNICMRLGTHKRYGNGEDVWLRTERNINSGIFIKKASTVNTIG